MTSNQRIKTVCFVIEGINSFAATLFTSYLYFFMRARFGFADRANLALAAGLGLVYALASWQAGRFAERRGYFTALKTGFGLMTAGLVTGSQMGAVPGQILAASVVIAGTCFIWPALEALVSEGSNPARAVGIYNIVWAGTNAAAFFIGGTLIENFGFATIFYTPLVLVLIQLAMTFWLQKHAAEMGRSDSDQPAPPPPDPARPAPARIRVFRRMGWLANPFAYIAINTLIAVLPGIAAKFQLTPMLAGFACSLWCFARFGAFVVLWRWPAWHYRFRWLIAAFAFLMLSFLVILVAPSLVVVLAAQLFFGAAIGLIYYSSLFYSMDASNAKGEHGGIHEAAIGLGNCAGPAVGAAALWLAPHNGSVGAWAVSGLLAVGLGGLIWLWKHPAGR